MKETNYKVVPKVWGREIWLVNRAEYCAKLLLLDEGAKSSWHKHTNKLETFCCLGGSVSLTVEQYDCMLTPFARPKTIMPGQFHSFYGISAATILEVSTHHDEDDVTRHTQSEPGTSHGNWPIKFPMLDEKFL